MYHDVRRPPFNDLEQVIRTRLQLDAHEELHEDEGTDLRRRKLSSTLTYAARKRLHGVQGKPDAKRREAFSFGFAGDRFPRCECHIMSRCSQGMCKWQHRPIVTRERSAGQERTHRARLSPHRSEVEPSRLLTVDQAYNERTTDAPIGGLVAPDVDASRRCLM